MFVGHIELTVTDAYGTVSEERTIPIRSYNRNMLRWMGGTLLTSGLVGGAPLIGINGANITTRTFYALGAAGVMKGLMVGTSDAAGDFLSHALDAVIEHGTAAGQLSYSAITSNYIETAGVSRVDFERTFTNGSGGDVVVREIALYGNSTNAGTGLTNTWMPLRDVLSSPLTVENSKALTVKLVFNFNAGTTAINSNGAKVLSIIAHSNTHTLTQWVSGTTSIGQTQQFTAEAGIGSTRGMRLGTSDAAFVKAAATQRFLDAEITVGTASGQLEHGDCIVLPEVSDETGGFIRVTRSFLNSSGASITVREICIVHLTSTTIFMMSRHVLPEPVIIENGVAREFSVDFKLTY
jgi:hypothetical protein